MKWLLHKLIELNISWNVITTWLTRFHRNAFYGPEINGNPIAYIGDLTFEIRTRVVRIVIRTRGNSRVNKSLIFIKKAIPLKDIPTCTSTDIYHMCRTRYLRWKGQRATEIELLNTPHDRPRCRQAMTPLWCSSINTLCFPQKTNKQNWCVHFRDRGWGRQRYLPARLPGDMATSSAIALDSSFNLILIGIILVKKDGNCQFRVIIGLRPRDRPARRDITPGSWCQQNTPFHD